MATPLGAHNARIAQMRELLTRRGRREQRAFSFEGPTLLAEAIAAGAQLRALYVTAPAYDRFSIVRKAEAGGAEVYVVDERALRRISAVESPSGIVAAVSTALEEPEHLLREPGFVLALAQVSDPGNAGSLLRSALAFGVERIIFDPSSVDPYNPKVVRAAMGSIFRQRLSVCAPESLKSFVDSWQVTGLVAGQRTLAFLEWSPRSMLVVGNERHGLGPWNALCTRLAGIPMGGPSESLNAGVAGAIALYEATGRTKSFQ